MSSGPVVKPLQSSWTSTSWVFITIRNMLKSQEAMCGRVLSQWWDGTEAAGPRSRPTVPFGEAPPDLEVLALQQNEPKCLA